MALTVSAAIPFPTSWSSGAVRAYHRQSTQAPHRHRLSALLKAMRPNSEAVAWSAGAREESRGAHSRIDFQKLDRSWGAKNNIIQRDGEAMKLRQENVPEMPDELRSLLAEEKGETARRG